MNKVWFIRPFYVGDRWIEKIHLDYVKSCTSVNDSRVIIEKEEENERGKEGKEREKKKETMHDSQTRRKEIDNRKTSNNFKF